MILTFCYRCKGNDLDFIVGVVSHRSCHHGVSLSLQDEKQYKQSGKLGMVIHLLSFSDKYPVSTRRRVITGYMSITVRFANF